MATGPGNELIRHLRAVTPDGNGEGLSDAELLGRFIRQKDETAFEAIVRRYASMVWGVCRRSLAQRQDLEDAFQTTFLVLVRRATSIVPREMLANWLHGVARRTALKAKANAANRQSRERQVTELPECGVNDPVWDDVRAVLDGELSRLPERYRTVLILCDLEGETRKAAARRLGCPEGSVAGWLSRARALLADRLRRRGIVLSGSALGTVLGQRVALAGLPASVLLSAIKTPALDLAGQTTISGGVSPEVATLTQQVIKSMLQPKLSALFALILAVTTACLGVGVVARTAGATDQSKSVAGTPPQPVENLILEAVDPALQGTWSAVSIDAVSGNSPETLKTTRLEPEELTMTFSAEQVIRRSPGDDGNIQEKSFEYTLDPDQQPLRLTLHTETHSIRYIYEVKDDTLRLCCFSLAEQDGVEVEDWPTEFSTSENRAKFPRLEVWKRVNLEGLGNDLLHPLMNDALVWGEEVNGLQAGIGIPGGDERAYRFGEVIPLQVNVRNVGEKPVTISYSPEGFRFTRPEIETAEGVRVTFQGDIRLAMPPAVRYIIPTEERVLEPGEEMVFGLVQLGIAPADASGLVPSPELRCTPGEYSIRYSLLMGKDLLVSTGWLRVNVEAAVGGPGQQ